MVICLPFSRDRTPLVGVRFSPSEEMLSMPSTIFGLMTVMSTLLGLYSSKRALMTIEAWTVWNLVTTPVSASGCSASLL